MYKLVGKAVALGKVLVAVHEGQIHVAVCSAVRLGNKVLDLAGGNV